MEDIPRNLSNLILKYKSEKGHLLTLETRSTGERYTDPENSEENKLKGFTVVDFHAFIILKDGWSLTFTVNNLFNEKYKETPYYYQPRRTLFLGIRYSFL